MGRYIFISSCMVLWSQSWVGMISVDPSGKNQYLPWDSNYEFKGNWSNWYCVMSHNIHVMIADKLQLVLSHSTHHCHFHNTPKIPRTSVLCLNSDAIRPQPCHPCCSCLSGFVSSNAHQLPSDLKSHLSSELTLPPELTSLTEPKLRWSSADPSAWSDLYC